MKRSLLLLLIFFCIPALSDKNETVSKSSNPAIPAKGSILVRHGTLELVTFPTGVPPYHLTNLIGWLNEPPGIFEVSGASGWITSPQTAIEYYLIPEQANEWGDTLIGCSEDGKAIRVSLPETGISEISQAFSYTPNPKMNLSNEVSSVLFTVTLDSNPLFGNPAFIITDPIDHKWGL